MSTESRKIQYLTEGTALTLKVGTQIACIHDHADSFEHPDVEYGFVAHCKDVSKGLFCRYWRRGDDVAFTLRTTANSELTNLDNLSLRISTSDKIVKSTLEDLGYTNYGASISSTLSPTKLTSNPIPTPTEPSTKNQTKWNKNS